MTGQRAAACLSLSLLMPAAPALAQSLTGSIAGTMKDELGGVLQGVAVTVTGKTGATSAITDAAGNYRFPALPPGDYELTAELPRFRLGKVEAIALGVGQQLTIDLVLRLAVTGETVNVVAKSAVVDVSSAATSNHLSQDLLFNLPLSRLAVGLLNVTPGINSDSAFGGGQGTGNAILLDGVDTRDPEYGTRWLQLNYNTIEEIEVQGPGAPAEYGGFTGGVINTITRSGGNRFSGLFDVQYSRQSFAGNNVTHEIALQNPGLADPGNTRKLLDITTQLSGPIVKDKLFFFVNAQRFHRNVDPPGPRTVRDDIDPRFNGKLTWQPSAKDHLMGMFQWDGFFARGVAGVPAFLATDDLTGEEDNPEAILNMQWRHLFGAKAFLEAKFVGWTSRDDFTPKILKPSHYDVKTGLYSVSAGYFFLTDVGRQQANVSFSRYAEAFGKHDLKFGLEIERGRKRDRFAFVDGTYFYDYGGQPYQALSYSYDISLRNERESVYVQDAWKTGTRLTTNGGLRFDWIRGKTPGAKAVYDTRSLAPRIGLAFDVAGDHRSVLKASYGRYYEAPIGSFYRRALPGVSDRVTYDDTGPAPVEVDRVATVLYGVDPRIAHPRMDEVTAGLERALVPDTRLALTGLWRRNGSFIDSVFPDARWQPVTVVNRLTNEPITVYRWANRTASQGSPLITNPDGFSYRDPAGNVLGTARAFRTYKALMLVVSRRLRSRWQAQGSYVLSKSEGAVNNNYDSSIGYSSQFESATVALVNPEGNLSFTRRHEVKVLGSYEVPKVEVGLSAFFLSVSGMNYGPFQRVSAGLVDFPQSAGRNVRLEPRGSRSTPRETRLDLRVEKVFRPGTGRDRLGLYADVRNVFNASTITFVQNRVPSIGIAGVPTPVLFGAPLGVTDARQAILAARWSF